MKDLQTGIIILAAGSSSRLGKPKQLLKYEGKALLDIALEAANHPKVEHKVLVLGADHQKIQSELGMVDIEILINENWNLGMATSLHVGLEHLMHKYDIEQVVVLLCDQPFIDQALIDQLITTQKNSQKGLVACRYENTIGVPVLFTEKYFDHIMKLKGKEGAKKLLAEFEDDLAIVDFPLGYFDIDTREDYEKLKSFK